MTRPAYDAGALQSRVVTSPFAKGETRTLLTHNHNDRVVSHPMFVEQLQALANLPVVVGDFSEIL